jgi:hypothetical protein
MIADSYWVIRAIVAARLGKQPDDADVSNFFEARLEDPAFSARAHRLFLEGVQSPSKDRRMILASALFGAEPPSSDIEEQERVDATIQKIFTKDIILLDQLVKFIEKHKQVLLLGDKNTATRFAFPAINGHAVELIETEVLPEGSEKILCPTNSLVNLKNSGCIDMGEPIGINGEYATAVLSIWPLGYSVLNVLRSVREQINRPAQFA